MKDQLSNIDRRKNYIILAENAYLDEDKKNAIKFYIKALKFKGNKADNIQILYNMAIIYDELDIPEKALKAYENIVRLDKRQAGAYYGMATMYERLKDKEKALKSYFKAVEIDPQYDRAYFYIENLYDEMEDKDKAIHYYQKVININPNDYIAYNNLGSIYEELKDYDKAYNMIKKSIEINPDYYKALFNMGVIYKKLNNHKKAIEYYDKSIENNNKNKAEIYKIVISALFNSFQYKLNAISFQRHPLDLFHYLVGHKIHTVKNQNFDSILF